MLAKINEKHWVMLLLRTGTPINGASYESPESVLEESTFEFLGDNVTIDIS